MKLISITLIIISIILSSCSNNDEITPKQTGPIIETEHPVKGTPGLAKTLVEDNQFIDVDIIQLNKDLIDATTRSRHIDNDINDRMAKAKAAIYRFYSNVSITENQFVLAPCTASELNIDESLFNTLKQNLEEMNEIARKTIENGEAVEFVNIDDEYLNSLLN